MNDDPNQPGYPPNQAYPPYQPPQGYGQPYDPNAPGAYPPQQGNPYGAPPYPPYGAPPPKKSVAPWIIGGCLGLFLLVGAVFALLAVLGMRHGGSTSSSTLAGSTTTSIPSAASTDAPASTDATASTDAATSTAETTQPAATADVAGMLQRAASNLQLPWQSGSLTVTSATADGTSLNMEGNVAEDMSQSGWDDFNTGMRRGLCSGGFADAIRGGGVLRLSLTDSVGNSEMLFVREC